ncbi:MAG: glycosyl hydrolase [Verrucomicrobiota bacterium]
MNVVKKAPLLVGTSLFTAISALAGLIDPNATPETVELFERMKAIPENRILFGQQHATCYGIGWENTDGTRSDVKTLTGSHPAVYGWDMGHFGTNDDRQLLIEAHERGAINTISWHMDNLLTGEKSWSGGEGVLAAHLPGGKAHDKLKEKLDWFAEFNNTLIDSEGKLIPIIFRPWHEHTGGWFWWGPNGGSDEEFNELWRFTVEYLRDEKKLHNLIYAYSPIQAKFESVEDYLTLRFPGLDYMDVVGFDSYSKLPERLAERSVIIAQVAREHGKVAAICEFGISKGLNNHDDPNWFMNVLSHFKTMEGAGGIAYMLTWRNGGLEHFWVPYEGHVNEPDFKKFAADPFILLENDLSEIK